VDEVHDVVLDLEPVTRLDALDPAQLASLEAISWQLKSVIDGKGRPGVRRPHIGKDQAAVFMDRIGAVAEPVLQRPVRRLVGCLQDPAVNIKQPPVIAAANSALRHDPKLE
jgi:hypothetical protein